MLQAMALDDSDSSSRLQAMALDDSDSSSRLQAMALDDRAGESFCALRAQGAVAGHGRVESRARATTKRSCDEHCDIGS